MIPKIIHYCWFGPKKYPKLVKKCIESWNKHLSDYQFILWNEKNTTFSNQFVLDACKAKKYAFVSDYIRLWALYNHGGIYLDTDMYLIKSLDNMLGNFVFMGYEKPDNVFISAGIIGAQKNNKFILSILNKYNDLVFTKNHYLDIKIPAIITNEYKKYNSKQEIKIFPYDFFYPFPFEDKDKINTFLKYKTKNTYAIHLWNLSWRSKSMKFKIKLKNAINTFFR